MDFLALVCIVFIQLESFGIHALTDPVILLTMKRQPSGVINIINIRGDPTTWGSSSGAYPNLPNLNFTPLGMGFDYYGKDVYFSDQGMKSLFKLNIEVTPTNCTLDINHQTIVYDGTSNAVSSISVDWMSGSVYWTDSSHNWIMVARGSSRGVYKRLVYTKLDKPIGVVVYPQRGFLYWSTIGALPKIERSNLDGSDRNIFISKDLTKPQGLTIDYQESLIYWVDSWTSTLEYADAITGAQRRSISVHSNNVAPQLYDMNLYKGSILMTDQSQNLIVANITDRSFKFIPLTNYVPYDVIVFDSNNQPTDDHATCASMNCSDICVSGGNGTYHCICMEGYSMVDDLNITCAADSKYSISRYIYSTNTQICTNDMITPGDPTCVTSPGGSFPSTLAFNFHSSRLFVADVDTGSIYRMITDFNNPVQSLVAANKKRIHGLSLDWIGDNLYYTDTDAGSISVSKLDGRYSKVLLNSLTKPWDIEVNPLHGLMYWSSANKIQMSNMDGSHKRTCLQITGANFQGLSIDIDNDSLFIVDQSLPGIRRLSLNCLDSTIAVQLENNTRIDDVTAVDNYLLWTNGTNIIGMAERRSDMKTYDVLPGSKLSVSDEVYQVVSYGYNMQPLPNQMAGKMDLCTACSQLCLLRSNFERTCSCSAGFTLVDSSACTSELLPENFLLLIDPVSKEGYQFALTNTMQNKDDETLIRALRFQSANQPSSITYDPLRRTFYWLDIVQSETSFFNEVASGATIKMKSIRDRLREINVLTIDKNIRPTKIDIISDLQTLIFDDVNTGHLHGYDLLGNMAWTYEYVDGLKDGLYTFDYNKMYLIWFDSRTSTIKKVHLSDNKHNYGDDIIQINKTNHVSNNDSSITITSTNKTDATNSTNKNPVKTLMQWTKDPIKGLTLSLDSETLLVIWTQNHVYVWNEPKIIYDKKFENTNFTSVVFDASSIYFVTWNENAIYQYNTNTEKLHQLSAGVFNRITDLRGFQSPDCCNGQTTNTDQSPSVQGHRDNGIIAGCVVALLLLIGLSAFACFMWRRKRSTEIIQRYYSTMVREQEQEIDQEHYSRAAGESELPNVPYGYNQSGSDAGHLRLGEEHLSGNMNASTEEIMNSDIEQLDDPNTEHPEVINIQSVNPTAEMNGNSDLPNVL